MYSTYSLTDFKYISALMCLSDQVDRHGGNVHIQYCMNVSKALHGRHIYNCLSPARRIDCKQMERRLNIILASKNTDKKYQSNGKIKKFAYQLIKKS